MNSAGADSDSGVGPQESCLNGTSGHKTEVLNGRVAVSAHPGKEGKKIVLFLSRHVDSSKYAIICILTAKHTSIVYIQIRSSSLRSL